MESPQRADLTLEDSGESDPTYTSFDLSDDLEREREDYPDPVERRGEFLTASPDAANPPGRSQYEYDTVDVFIDAYGGIFGTDGAVITASVISASATDGSAGASPLEASITVAAGVEHDQYTAGEARADSISPDMEDPTEHPVTTIEASPSFVNAPGIGSHAVETLEAEPYYIHRALDGTRAFSSPADGIRDPFAANRLQELDSAFPPIGATLSLEHTKPDTGYVHSDVGVDADSLTPADDSYPLDALQTPIEPLYDTDIKVVAEVVDPIGTPSELASTTDDSYVADFADGGARTVGPEFQSQIQMALVDASVENFTDRSVGVYPIAFAEGKAWAFLLPRSRPPGLWVRNGVKYEDSGSWAAVGDPSAGVSL